MIIRIVPRTRLMPFWTWLPMLTVTETKATRRMANIANKNTAQQSHECYGRGLPIPKHCFAARCAKPKIFRLAKHEVLISAGRATSLGFEYFVPK